MDTRDTPEQAELRRAARQLAHELGPGTVAGLDDATRRARLAGAVRSAGWLELRDDAGAGAPLASGVETAIVADALGGAVADVAFTGPSLAADLARRAGSGTEGGRGVAYSPDLLGAAVVSGPVTTTPLPVLDAVMDSVVDTTTAYVLVPNPDPARTGDGFELGEVDVEGTPDTRAAPAAAPAGADLTRAVRWVPAGTPVRVVPGQHRPLTADDLVAWSALGLALTSADLVGVMRGILDVTVAYAVDRHQYGVAVGSFQAVQHLLAEARCLMEGSLSVAVHASWAVDDLEPEEARAAGRIAKAYCARAARTVCETAVQVHGGIGNTWECVAHVHLRRALLSTQWFGDDGEQLRALQAERLTAGVEDRVRA